MGGTFSRRGQGPLVKEEMDGATVVDDVEKTEPPPQMPEQNGAAPQAVEEPEEQKEESETRKTQPMFDDTQRNFVEDGRSL